jgi:hypothetical protein
MNDLGQDIQEAELLEGRRPVGAIQHDVAFVVAAQT